MKLYYSPGACSLADHIALHASGIPFEIERVDLSTKTTASGADFHSVNSKGYVPALTIEGGETLSENVAILDWIADQEPGLRPQGAMGRTHLLEALAFISTEVHKNFKPFFAGGGDEEKAKAGDAIAKRLQFLADRLDDDYLLGPQFSVADAYLFVMLGWAAKKGIAVPATLSTYAERLGRLDSVRKALEAEEGA